MREIAHEIRTLMMGSDTLDGSSTEKLLCLERRKRKQFVAAVFKTKPGFDGEHDSFKIEVTDVGEGDLNEGVVERKVGDVLHDITWKKKKPITSIGEVVSPNRAENGWQKGKVCGYNEYYRGDLCKLIETRRGRELPGFMNFRVFTSVMSDYVRRWQQPAEEYQEAVKGIMLSVATSIANSRIRSWPKLASLVNATLRSFFLKSQASVVQRLARLIVQECSPSTENHYLWDTINKIRNDRVKKKINAMADSSVRERVSGGQYQRAEGFVRKSDVIAMLQSTLSGDISNEAQEVQDMIDMLSAYWKLSAKRYVDQVGMIITDLYTHPDLVRQIEDKFQQLVKQGRYGGG